MERVIRLRMESCFKYHLKTTDFLKENTIIMKEAALMCLFLTLESLWSATLLSRQNESHRPNESNCHESYISDILKKFNLNSFKEGRLFAFCKINQSKYPFLVKFMFNINNIETFT